MTFVADAEQRMCAKFAIHALNNQNVCTVQPVLSTRRSLSPGN